MKNRMNLQRLLAALLALVLLLGLGWLGTGLERRPPAALPDTPAQEIQAEAPLADEHHSDGQGENQSPEEEPPQEPPDTPQEPPEEEHRKDPPREEAPTPENAPDTQTETVPDPDDTQPGPGGGDTDDGSQGQDVPTEGGDKDTELRIITDLANTTITYNQLENDTLPFYAYLINGGTKTLRVKLQNSATPQNGLYLTPEGHDYTARLQRGELNRFTLYVKDGREIVHEVTYRIRYMAQKADEDHPTIGDHPPTITTNLEGVTELSNRNFTMTLTARDYHGHSLYASSIDVRMDGRQIQNPTGRNPYEYQLYFPKPDNGDTARHHITVTAWDKEGNSAFVRYDVLFRFVDNGDVIGTATILLDATTVGLGIMEDPYTYQIRQGQPASYAVKAMLEDCGYEVTYGGSLDTGFYVRRISRGGICDYAAVPDALWQKVLDDGLTLTRQSYNDSLGEFDYTQGSGWVYSIGGDTYAGKGLSSYYLSDGDTLYLRFTLAYGKDVGGAVDQSNQPGLLDSYCGKWINGTYIPLHQWGQKKYTQEPTCTEDGYIYHKCTVCGEKNIIETLPATGHDFQEVERVEPTDGADGWILQRCKHCGEERKEVIPWTPTPGNEAASAALSPACWHWPSPVRSSGPELRTPWMRWPLPSAHSPERCSPLKK